jgi:hypothetical protein
MMFLISYCRCVLPSNTVPLFVRYRLIGKNLGDGGYTGARRANVKVSLEQGDREKWRLGWGKWERKLNVTESIMNSS